MTAPDVTLWSRRAFIKTGLATAATTVIISTEAQPEYLDNDSDDQPDRLTGSALSLSNAAQLVRNKKVSPVELTQECLKRIEQLNPKLNAFITLRRTPP